MKSLSRIFSVAKKELMEAVSTPLLFIMQTLFVMLTGYFLYLGAIYYSELSANWLINQEMQGAILEPTTILLPPLFSNYALLLLFFIPLLTMSTFANERKEGTLELLFTYPLRDIELIFGKWLGVSSLLFLLFTPLWVYPLVSSHMGLEISISTYAVGLLGLWLLASFFVAVGIFVSSLFESQTASAILTVGLLMILWTSEGAEIFQFDTFSPLMANFCIQKYLQPFLRGILSTENILSFSLGISFFLFLTFRALERRTFRSPL